MRPFIGLEMMSTLSLCQSSSLNGQCQFSFNWAFMFLKRQLPFPPFLHLAQNRTQLTMDNSCHRPFCKQPLHVLQTKRRVSSTKKIETFFPGGSISKSHTSSFFNFQQQHNKCDYSSRNTQQSIVTCKTHFPPLSTLIWLLSITFKN